MQQIDTLAMILGPADVRVFDRIVDGRDGLEIGSRPLEALNLTAAGCREQGTDESPIPDVRNAENR